MSAVPPVATVFHGRPPHVFLFSLRDRRGSHGRVGRKKVLAASGLSFAAEGPSCIFVGPIETASQEMLEALYHQARDSYYSGQPLVADDMFDRVELKLRLYGSKSVVKYPRCSLRRQSTYADAEEDPSQVLALASVWILLLAFGASAVLVPIIYSISLTYKEMFGASVFLDGGRSHMKCLISVNNNMLLMGLGCLIGYPLASASVQALQGLLKNDLVALKGSCPNCGEEVFAFIKEEKYNRSAHSTECHVCQCDLEFRAKVEQSGLTLRRRQVYGRVYLVRRMS